MSKDSEDIIAAKLKFGLNDVFDFSELAGFCQNAPERLKIVYLWILSISESIPECPPEANRFVKQMLNDKSIYSGKRFDEIKIYSDLHSVHAACIAKSLMCSIYYDSTFYALKAACVEINGLEEEKPGTKEYFQNQLFKKIANLPVDKTS